MSNNIAESSKLYGRMTVTVFDKGVRQYSCTKMNQITDDGRKNVLQLLAWQSHPEYRQIWSLSVGDGTTPPAASQQDLIDPLLSLQLSSSELTYVDALYELHVHKEIEANVGTGYVLSEAGIFTRGNADLPADVTTGRYMYARQIFPPITKAATMSIVFDWHLGMTVQAA